MQASKGRSMAEASGWIRSTDRRPFSDREMCEYADNVFEKLRSSLNAKPCRILEIGVGSGLLMQRLAPHAEKYVGIDIDRAILEKCREFMAGDMEHVELHELFAHEIRKIDGSFDIILMNSVMQYFPDFSYAERVLKECTGQLRGDGVVFCGDIMDADKKEELCEYIAKESEQRQRPNLDRQLLYSRSFFFAAAGKLSANCEVSDKIYRIPNELSLFRYDAMLHM